ncbi:hypothetical protein Sjap_025752 [Stephania japonica]|uniref:Cytochrome P450 n=1 Tax=Stephania japonica TaxID=461633 RepID=A0AAP0E2D0_9MAGN
MEYFLVISAVVLSFWVAKVLIWVWWKPKNLEKLLREQGFNGTSHMFFFRDLRQLVSMTENALSKPINLSHNIVPRVLPFIHETIRTHGKHQVAYVIYLVWNNSQSEHIRARAQKGAKYRKIITPAYHIEKLKLMEPAFYSSSAELVEGWEKLVSNGSSEVDVCPYIQKLTADVISKTAFGSSYEGGRRIFQLQSEQAKLIVEVMPFLFIPGFRFLPTKKNRRIKEIGREIRGILSDMINKRENATKDGEAHEDDLLGMLLESNRKVNQENDNSKWSGMTIEDIIEECKLFYIAGHDTTSSLLVWTMVALRKQLKDRRKPREVLEVQG